jgi:hypothetical protein
VFNELHFYPLWLKVLPRLKKNQAFGSPASEHRFIPLVRALELSVAVTYAAVVYMNTATL